LKKQGNVFPTAELHDGQMLLRATSSNRQ